MVVKFVTVRYNTPLGSMDLLIAIELEIMFKQCVSMPLAVHARVCDGRAHWDQLRQPAAVRMSQTGELAGWTFKMCMSHGFSQV